MQENTENGKMRAFCAVSGYGDDPPVPLILLSDRPDEAGFTAAVSAAAAEFRSTPAGKKYLDGSCGEFSWDDVPEIPESILAAHGLRKLPELDGSCTFGVTGEEQLGRGQDGECPGSGQWDTGWKPEDIGNGTEFMTVRGKRVTAAGPMETDKKYSRAFVRGVFGELWFGDEIMALYRPDR